MHKKVLLLGKHIHTKEKVQGQTRVQQKNEQECWVGGFQPLPWLELTMWPWTAKCLQRLRSPQCTCR